MNKLGVSDVFSDIIRGTGTTSYVKPDLQLMYTTAVYKQVVISLMEKLRIF